MYYTHLNLLPPEKQQRLNRMMYIQFARTILEIFLIAVCISGITLLGAQWVMDNYFNTLITTLTSTTQKDSHTNRQISTVNKLIRDTDTIQSRYTLWTPRITDVTNAAPGGISFTSLILDTKNKTYAINGVAKTRNELLQYKSQLEKLPYIVSVDFPPSQLTSRTDFPFSLTIATK